VRKKGSQKKGGTGHGGKKRKGKRAPEEGVAEENGPEGGKEGVPALGGGTARILENLWGKTTEGVEVVTRNQTTYLPTPATCRFKLSGEKKRKYGGVVMKILPMPGFNSKQG